MIDLSDDMGIEEVFDITPSDVVIDPSEAIYNGSINGSVDPFENDLNITSETMRLLFITIATISVLACLSICLSVFICVCLNRYVHYAHSESEFDYSGRFVRYPIFLSRLLHRDSFKRSMFVPSALIARWTRSLHEEEMSWLLGFTLDAGIWNVRNRKIIFSCPNNPRKSLTRKYLHYLQ